MNQKIAYSVKNKFNNPIWMLFENIKVRTEKVDWEYKNVPFRYYIWKIKFFSYKWGIEEKQVFCSEWVTKENEEVLYIKYAGKQTWEDGVYSSEPIIWIARYAYILEKDKNGSWQKQMKYGKPVKKLDKNFNPFMRAKIKAEGYKDMLVILRKTQNWKGYEVFPVKIEDINEPIENDYNYSIEDANKYTKIKD